MYHSSEYTSVSSQLKGRYLLLFLPCTMLLTVQVWAILQRNQTLTVLLGAVIIAWFVFALDLFVLPVSRYRRFLYEVLHGPRHEVAGHFTGADQELSVVDGVPFRSVHVSCLDDAGEVYDRLFYLDAEKKLPELSPGQRVHIVYHDRQIVDLHA